ncbi:MAG: hypothetical protein ABIJ00_08150 [Candidatus Eisenbacteria bacterium]
MATKVKIVRARDFLQTTTDDVLDLEASCQVLKEVAAARRPPADFDVLLDFRRAQWRLSTMDIYGLAAALAGYEDLRTSKIAVLVLPGANFDQAQFLETCSVNRGMNVDAFTNFEDAVQWFFTSVDVGAGSPN